MTCLPDLGHDSHILTVLIFIWLGKLQPKHILIQRIKLPHSIGTIQEIPNVVKLVIPQPINLVPPGVVKGSGVRIEWDCCLSAIGKS